MFIGPSRSNDYTPPSIWGLTLLKIDLEGKGHRFWKRVFKILEIPFKCRGDYMYSRANLGLMSVTMSSQRFPLVKELKNILIEPFEFIFFLHAIHSVKLPKIVGVESSRCNLVPRPPNQKLLPCICILNYMTKMEVIHMQVKLQLSDNEMMTEFLGNTSEKDQINVSSESELDSSGIVESSNSDNAVVPSRSFNRLQLESASTSTHDDSLAMKAMVNKQILLFVHI